MGYFKDVCVCQASCDRSQCCYKHANYDLSEQLVANVANVITISIRNHRPVIKKLNFFYLVFYTHVL